jgi:hypothetical protein
VTDAPVLTPIDRAGVAVENNTLATVVGDGFIRVTAELGERDGILLEGKR